MLLLEIERHLDFFLYNSPEPKASLGARVESSAPLCCRRTRRLRMTSDTKVLLNTAKSGLLSNHTRVCAMTCSKRAIDTKTQRVYSIYDARYAWCQSRVTAFERH